MTTQPNTRTLAERINAFEFGHVFTLHPDGTITEPRGIYAPDVCHDDATDITIDGKGWRALTGMTGQYGYNGAVMHASEYIGKGIADYLLELAADEPQTFVVVVVECLPDEDEDEDADVEPAGWAILMADRAVTA